MINRSEGEVTTAVQGSFWLHVVAIDIQPRGDEFEAKGAWLVSWKSSHIFSLKSFATPFAWYATLQAVKKDKEYVKAAFRIQTVL